MRSLALFAGTLLCSLSLQAGVVGYTLNPTTNSTDFATAVSALSGVIGDAHFTVDYEAHPLGALNPNFYPGFTINFSPATATVTTALSGGGSVTSPTSPGEGLVTSGQHIYPASTFDLEVTFIDPLLGFGFYIIDYYNPSGVNPGLLKAWDGPNGTGTLLGSFSTAQYDFQYNNKYFVGVTDSDRRIKSVTFGLPGGAGDSVYFDDLQLASGIPEPATMLLAGLALGIVVYFDRRRNRDQQ